MALSAKPLSQLLVIVPLLLALVSSAYFITTLPTTPRIDGEPWISPLGVKPFGDDAGEYLKLADSFRENRAFEFQGEPTRIRPPLYPLLIAALGSSLRAIQWVQAGLIVGSVFLVYLMGRRLWSGRAGLLAATMVAAFTPFTVRSALVMSEALFIVLLLAALHATIEGTRTRSVHWLIAGGIWFGLAVLVRPVAIVLPLVLIPAMVYGHREGASVKSWFRPLGLYLAAFVLVLLPWTARNTVTLGDFTPLPSSGGVNLWAASHPDWRGFVDNHMAYAWELPEFFDIGQGDYYISAQANSRFREAAFDNILGDPVGWAARNTAKLSAVAYASFPQELRDAAHVSELSGEGSGRKSLVGLGTVVAMALALGGAALSIRHRTTWMLLVTVAYFYAVDFVSFAEARHLLPIVPLYALLVAVGLVTVVPSIGRWLNPMAAEQRAREVEGEHGRASRS